MVSQAVSGISSRQWYLKQKECYIPVSLSHIDQYKVQCFWKWNVSGWCMRKISHYYNNGVKIPGQTEGSNSVRWVDDEGNVIRACLLRLEERAGGEKRTSGSWVLLSVALLCSVSPQPHLVQPLVSPTKTCFDSLFTVTTFTLHDIACLHNLASLFPSFLFLFLPFLSSFSFFFPSDKQEKLFPL